MKVGSSEVKFHVKLGQGGLSVFLEMGPSMQYSLRLLPDFGPPPHFKYQICYNLEDT